MLEILETEEVVLIAKLASVVDQLLLYGELDPHYIHPTATKFARHVRLALM